MKLTILLLFFLILRILPIWGNNFPFAYDNAKDSLEMMEMWVSKKPALLGAVTSMEGLYQGPMWYYILFPLNVLFNFHPIASVVTVLVLGMITTWLLWKHIGKFEAFLFTVSAGVIPTQQTAWSPYLTLFSTTWSLIILSKLQPKLKTLHLLLLAASMTLLFHAEIAFGVVFCLLMLSVFIIRKIRPSLIQLFLAGLVFALPFTPQAMFELRHDFLQTRSVLRFISNYNEEKAKVQENATGIARVGEVASYISTNAIESILPYRVTVAPPVAIALVAVALLSLYAKRNRISKKVLATTLPFILGSFVLYLFLPVKPFYLIGIIPFWIFLFAQTIKRVYPGYRIVLAIIFVLFAIAYMSVSRQEYLLVAQNSRALFEQKRQAVETAYTLTQGKPFASYQYVPEVYDYTYQHIYQYTSRKLNRTLPTEYAYEPGASAYMQTKRMPGDTRAPEYTALIVEADPRPQFFPVWWEKMASGKVVEKTFTVNESIMVYLLKDKAQE